MASNRYELYYKDNNYFLLVLTNVSFPQKIKTPHLRGSGTGYGVLIEKRYQ
jgi:hypothetical protein